MAGEYGSGVYGYGLYGALAYSGPPVVTIDGLIVSVPDFPGVGDDIGQRSQMQFSVTDASGSLTIRPGQNVRVTDGSGSRVWEGWVSTATLQALGHTSESNAYGWQVAAVDNVYLADKRVAAASYTNQTAGFIVTDLITNYLAAEGVVAGIVDAGPTLTSYVINYETISSHLDKLATLANFYWNIDKDRQVWFAPFSLLPAPWVFDGSQADDPDGSNLMAIQYSDPMYRNGQYVLGITDTTTTQTESRKGDGTTTAFLMSYPLHNAPTVKVDGVSKTVGVKGTTTGKDWYWNKGDPTISQDSGGTVLTSSNTLQVVYIGEFQTIAYSEDGGAISDRLALEGGTTSGKVQQATVDTTVVTTAQGFQMAAALLAKYATSGKTLTFLTRTSGLFAGQLLTVNVPAAPWKITSETYLIQSCQLVYHNFEWQWIVTALSGPVNDTWVNFWQRIAGAIGVISSTTAGTSSTLVLLESASIGVSVAVSGSATPTTYNYPSATLYPAPTLYPGIVGTPVAITWTKTNSGLNALRDVLSGTDTSLEGAYLAWGTGTQGTPATATRLAVESGRKALATFANGGVGAVTLDYVLGPQDANGVAITEVGVFGGASATGTANSGILLLYGAYTHTKANTESINIQPTLTFS